MAGGRSINYFSGNFALKMIFTFHIDLKLPLPYYFLKLKNGIVIFRSIIFLFLMQINVRNHEDTDFLTFSWLYIVFSGSNMVKMNGSVNGSKGPARGRRRSSGILSKITPEWVTFQILFLMCWPHHRPIFVVSLLFYYYK